MTTVTTSYPDDAGGNPSYDEFGNPTQGNLWLQADALGAFGFSRPEDVATNPFNGSEAVLNEYGGGQCAESYRDDVQVNVLGHLLFC